MLLIKDLIYNILSLFFSGYTNITFAARPMESYYTVTNRATTMYCRAQGVSTVTGKIVELDIVFTRNGEPIDIYDTPSRHYYLNDNGFTSTGLTIYPTELEDDQSVYRCQVYVNSKPYDMYTDNITLTVAGEFIIIWNGCIIVNVTTLFVYYLKSIVL